MEEEVFKVVLNAGKGLASAIERQHELIYNVNEWTKPQLGKIFTFKTLRHAKEFHVQIGDYLCYEIWKGLGKNPKPIKQISYFSDNIAPFWRGIGGGVHHAPPGTIVVDELKLLEKIA